MDNRRIDAYSKLLKGSSIFSLIENAEKYFPLLEEHIQFDEGEDYIFTEGSKLEHLIIGLDTDIEIWNNVATATQKTGLVPIGRSINLNAFIQRDALRYSIRLSKPGHFLKIPYEVMNGIWEEEPMTLSYLSRVTESFHFRILSKQLNEVCHNSLFVVHFFCYLEEIKYSPQSWIVKKDEALNQLNFIVDGQAQVLEVKNGSGSKFLWYAPQKTWLLPSEFFEQKMPKYVVKSIDAVKSIAITKQNYDVLAARFPQECETFRIWLRSGNFKTLEENQEQQEVEDLEDLFKDAIEFKPSRFQKYPWVQQNDMMDCGPACLAMISKFYGNPLSIQYWRAKLSTDKDGTSMFDLALTAEQNGFIAHAFAFETAQEISKDLLPAIVIRHSHFTVLYDHTDKNVTLGNPAKGIETLDTKEFHDGFEQCALLLKPKTDFLEIAGSGQPYSHFFALFKGFEKELLLIFFCSFLLMVMNILPPILSQIMIDEVLVKKDLRLLYLIVAGTVGVSGIVVFLTWAQNYYINYVSARFDFRAKAIFTEKLLSLPYSFFAARHIGDFTRRLSELEQIREFITKYALSVFLNFFVIIFYFMIVFSYSKPLGVMLIFVTPPFIMISMFFSKRLVLRFSEYFTKMTSADSYLYEALDSVNTLKTLGGETSTRWKLENRYVESLNAQYAFNNLARFSVSISSMYYFLIKYAIYGFSIYLAIEGELSAGQVIALGMIVNQVIQPFNDLAGIWDQLQQVKAVVGRLNDIFLTPSEQVKTSRGVKVPELKGEIEFRDVWFRYGGEATEWVLRGVSFKIEAGQKVAIVGPSGSGKSTIGALLTRMYEPTRGQIFIDGKDYRDYDTAWLREQIGIFLQETHLFYGTIADNISFYTPEPNFTNIEKSAEKACAMGFISEKSLGLEYRVSHGGLGLSGGEKQRISLARVYYRNPSIFVLDEATAALDGIAERELLGNMRKHHGHSTIINIAHRYSTVLASDYVLVMNKGRVLDIGTNDYLSTESEIYQALFGLGAKFSGLKRDEDQAQDELPFKGNKSA